MLAECGSCLFMAGIAGYAASPAVFSSFVGRPVVVAALVVDYGSGTCYAGFTGVDTFHTVYPSVVARPNMLGQFYCDIQAALAVVACALLDLFGRYGPEGQLHSDVVAALSVDVGSDMCMACFAGLDASLLCSLVCRQAHDAWHHGWWDVA